MPNPVQIIQGAFGKWHVDELVETGVLTKGVKFSLDVSVMDTKAHVSGSALNQIVRTRTNVSALLIDFEAEAITDGNGELTGLAKVYAGKNIAVCAHFAADASADHTVLGFSRDSTKYLQVQDPGLDLSPENPVSIKWKGRYLPEITFDAAAA